MTKTQIRNYIKPALISSDVVPVDYHHDNNTF